MSRLHSTLLASPNPALLEIRILANHAADERFSFLRKGGPFRKVWEEMRSAKKVEAVVGGGLGGLVGYGSDSEDDDDVAEELADKTDEQPEIDPTTAEALKKSLKLAKALDWSAKRKAARELASQS